MTSQFEFELTADEVETAILEYLKSVTGNINDRAIVTDFRIDGAPAKMTHERFTVKVCIK